VGTPDELRDFRADDLQSFKIDSTANQLYWNGKKVRLGGWSLTEKITIIGILIAAIVSAATNYPEVPLGGPDQGARRRDSHVFASAEGKCASAASLSRRGVGAPPLRSA
jgi:hypothetical protein